MSLPPNRIRGLYMLGYTHIFGHLSPRSPRDHNQVSGHHIENGGLVSSPPYIGDAEGVDSRYPKHIMFKDTSPTKLIIENPWTKSSGG